MTAVVTVRPPLGRLLLEFYSVVVVVAVLAWLFDQDPIGLGILVAIYSLALFPMYHGQAVTLTPDGLSFRSTGWSPRDLRWPAVQSISLGRGPFGSIVVHAAPWDRVEQYRMTFGRGAFLLRPAQAALRTQLEQWWVAHRGADWRPGPPVDRFRFPPDVNPFEAPAHD
jgi:hypothetical protein